MSEIEPYDSYEEFEQAVHIPDQFDGADDMGNFHDARYGRVSGNTAPSIHYVNESGLPDDVVFRHFNRGSRFHEQASSMIEKWSQSLSMAPINQTVDVFNRNKFGDGAAHHIHATMSRCAWAVENDDILSTLSDVVEGLTWQKCRFELIDEDQQSMWNQWAGTIDMDGLLRKLGREEFKVSQFYVGLWWEKKVYSVEADEIEERLAEFEFQARVKEREKAIRARQEMVDANKGVEGFIEPPELEPVEKEPKGRGNRSRKKKFPVMVPVDATVFDPTKIMPVGMLMFGRERFAYIATQPEHEAFKSVMQGDVADGTVLQLIEKQYEPNGQDMAACAEIGVDPKMLWLLKEDAVFRHTMTKADYERYAPVRLKPILPILEMKQHLRAADRASLIGNTNFIVVITKGSDRLPAKAAEIANLQEQAKVIARLPVLVGDHRLKVEIISPAMDNTLIESRWETLDSRLVFAALKSYSPVIQGGTGGGAGVSEMSRVIGKGLESRRHMIIRTLEKAIFKKILAKNEGVLDEEPTLAFTPKRITLDFSADIIAQVLKLRDRGDISRETTLEELDYDQDTEVLRRGREKVMYDDTFASQTPFSSPLQNPYGTPGQPGQPGQPPQLGAPGAEKPNVGPNGQPRTEGGRPPAKTEDEPRARKGSKKTGAASS